MTAGTPQGPAVPAARATIVYTVRPNCRRHSTLFRRPVPHSRSLSLTEEELYAYATLKLQNPKIASRATFVDTRPLFGSLRTQHGVYLSLQARGLLCTAEDEDLVPISEIVGVACGVASAVAAIGVNPNRFARIRISGARLDFEFKAHGKSCQLECKGTTYARGLKGLLRKTKRKKRRTSRRFDAAFGAVTIFATPNRGNDTRTVMFDPPGKRPDRSDEVPEEALLLRHYWPYLGAVLTPNAFTDWLLASLQALEAHGAAPAPVDARPLPRVIERFGSFGEFYGTIFDARFTNDAMARFETLALATEALGSTSTFVGVHRDVVQAIAAADWPRLKELSWPPTSSDEAALLPSGVLTKSVLLPADNAEILAANFASGREGAFAARRARGRL